MCECHPNHQHSPPNLQVPKVSGLYAQKPKPTRVLESAAALMGTQCHPKSEVEVSSAALMGTQFQPKTKLQKKQWPNKLTDDPAALMGTQEIRGQVGGKDRVDIANIEHEKTTGNSPKGTPAVLMVPQAFPTAGRSTDNKSVPQTGRPRNSKSTESTNDAVLQEPREFRNPAFTGNAKS